MLTKEQLQEIRNVIGDMRFMQASALVASRLNEHKEAKAYMSKLHRLDDAVAKEITG